MNNTKKIKINKIGDKHKKIILVLVIIEIIIIISLLATGGKLTNLSGNSVTHDYPCDEDYTFEDNKCVKVVEKNAVLLGDIDKNGIINVSDRIYLSRYIDKWQGYTLDEFSKVAADINKDNKIDESDINLLNNYLSDNKEANLGIGKDRFCPKNYNMDGTYCKQTIVKDLK